MGKSKAIREKIHKVKKLADEVLLGKSTQLNLAIISLISGGHLLVEDVPGVGKTTMVYLLGKLLGLEVSRIQFTNDLLPSDIIGTTVFDKDSNCFNFKKGPIFGQLILADELNRASPKTQSALLQAMEEKKISVDGKYYELGVPFIIVATQNPIQQIGTFPLPESQLDRFFMSIYLDYPAREYEHIIIKSDNIMNKIENIVPVLSVDDLNNLSKIISDIHISDDILNYILDILAIGRNNEQQGVTLSTRAGKDLALAAKAYAMLENRDFVIPEDVQAVSISILSHRLGGLNGIKHGQILADEIIKQVSVS